MNAPWPLDQYGRREKHWSADGNKQIVRTGNKEFDRQTSADPCYKKGTGEGGMAGTNF